MKSFIPYKFRIAIEFRKVLARSKKKIIWISIKQEAPEESEESFCVLDEFFLIAKSSLL